MKRLITVLSLLGCAILVIAVAQGQVRKTDRNGEGYHHLLLLDQREAVEHAKSLNFYVRHHAPDLDHQVLVKHIDELGRNLTGMQDELGKVEEVASTEKKSIAPDVAEIKNHQLKARLEFEALRLEAQKEKPEPIRLEAKSLAIYDELKQADAHHHKIMRAHGVREADEPGLSK